MRDYKLWLEPVAEDADLMSIVEFQESCASGAISDDEGSAYLVIGSTELRPIMHCKDYKKLDPTWTNVRVAWYNK